MQFGGFFTKAILLKNDSRQSGQALVFFALLVPLLILFAGVVVDLGWYYLNVSRLQNAADAAVLAGAKKLLEDLKNNHSKYKSYKVTLVYHQPDDSNLYTVSSLTKSSTKSDTDITTEIKSNADNIAVKYVQKNLSSDSMSSLSPSFFSVAEAAETDESYSLEDSWARKNKYNEIKMESPKIYKDGDDFYYVVHLEENVQHFLLPGKFEPMAAPVVAVAKISKETTTSSGSTPKVVFAPNGGHFVNPTDGSTTTESLSIGNITKAINESGSIAVIVPDGYSSTPERDEYEFLRYWTNENGLRVPYGTVLTEDNIEEFFKTYDPNAKDNDDYNWENGVVTLYAQWVKVKQKPVTLIFDPNGGSFSDGTTTNDSKQIKAPKEMEDDETTDPITPNKGKPTREGYEFYGWSTDKNADANSLVANYISDGKQMTKNEIGNLFGNNTSVTLYAVWKKINSTVPENPKPHNNKTLWEQMQYLIAKNVYDQNWDVSVVKYGSGAIYHNSFRDCSNIYLNDYHYYTEKVDMGEYDEQRYWASPTYRKIGEQTHYFLDFLRNGTIKDGNTNLGIPKYGFTYDSRYRTHSLVNVNTRYAVRKGYNDDPLYCNFEGEPYVGDATPIRQIVININVSNLDDKYRPLFFYYEGPDARPGKKDRVSILRPDSAQPVILNLNADFKGVLFMPDVPVVINGNGHTFEGFIVAKEYRYLDTSQGTQVRYKSNGTILTNSRQTSDNKIHVNTSNGNVYSKVATGANALATYNSYATKSTNGFNLSSNSKFRTFTVDTDVKFMYVFYDNNKTMDETPFHEYADLDKDLIPLYKLDDAGNPIRVTKWADVKLYDSNDFATRNEIPKQLTDDKSIRTVRLDSDGNPAPLYDEAGNPVYFCDDYIKLTGTYTVFTLDKVADGTRDEKEFLLTKTNNLNVPDTDDWK